MKTKCIFLMTLCAFVCMLGYSRTNIPLSTEIPIGGGGARTPVPSPTAYLDDDEVQVLLSVAAPLTITVCGQAGNCLFSKEYASTQEAIIPLSENGITQGDYVLRVFSQGLCWKGNFTIEASKQAPATIGDWWYEWDGQTYLDLFNDDGEHLDSLKVWMTSGDGIWIGHVSPTYDRRLPRLGIHSDSIKVVITGESNDTVYQKETWWPRLGIDLNAYDIQDGVYTLNLFWAGLKLDADPTSFAEKCENWNECWWRVEFEFLSHKPKGLYVSIDSTYYRLHEGYANTVWPDDVHSSITYRMLYNLFERDYPIHVVIPQELTYEGETYTVVGIGQRSFKGCYYMQSISLPNTITYIDGGAFMACRNLDHVNIPESVTRIEGSAFAECDRLSFMVIPEGIETLANSMFRECTNLSAVTLPGSLTSIEEWAFALCTSLPYIDIPDNVTRIGASAFQACSSLMEMKLPKKLKKIDMDAFRRCQRLTSIDFPEAITYIGVEAFLECTGLQSITLPGGISRIGDRAFKDMPNSAHIYCHAIKPFPIDENTFNYNCTLHVPQGTKDLYEKAEYWKNFKVIEEEPVGEAVRFGGETGVTSATLDAESAERFYDLQGRPVDGTQKGILIRNGKKVLVK